MVRLCLGPCLLLALTAGLQHRAWPAACGWLQLLGGALPLALLCALLLLRCGRVLSGVYGLGLVAVAWPGSLLLFNLLSQRV